MAGTYSSIYYDFSCPCDQFVYVMICPVEVVISSMLLVLFQGSYHLPCLKILVGLLWMDDHYWQFLLMLL